MESHLLTQAASPFHDLLGIELEEWRDGFARLVCRPGPQHGNRGGIVHGGVMLAMLDQVNAFAGLFCPVPGRRRSAVTLDLDARFTAPGRIGGMLRAEGHLVTAGRAVFFAQGQVLDDAGQVVAFGGSTHRYRSGSHALEGVPVGG